MVTFDYMTYRELPISRREGPFDITPEQSRELATAATFPQSTRVKRWRCKDADGELCYGGIFIGPDEYMFAPLDDFCKPDAGAVTIEYMEWKEL